MHACRSTLEDPTEAVNAGQDIEAALARALPGVTVATLEQRMVQHRRDSESRPRGLCPLPFPIPPERLADVGGTGPRVEPVDRDEIKQLFLQLWLLPRRAGYVDWFPPEAPSLAGAGVRKE